RERLVTSRPDAFLMCGTNLSSMPVADRLEAQLGVPILGINPTLLWFALRENGIDARLRGGGLLWEY
ncbi:MAG: hypothetical protein AAFZ65_17670, partial [Planctomycetota bacterium]